MQQPRVEQSYFHRLVLTDNSVLEVGKPFPGTEDVIGVIDFSPEAIDEESVTPAEYECWVLPDLLMAVVMAKVMFERAKQLKQHIPGEAISQLVRNETELDEKVPLILCYTVQASQVRTGVKLVPVELAKQEMIDFHAALHGLETEDEDDEDDAPPPRPQVAAPAPANGG